MRARVGGQCYFARRGGDDLDDVIADAGSTVAIWDDPDTRWNVAMWPGQVTTARWLAVSGIGYAASIRVKADVECVTTGPRWILAEGVWDDGGICW